MGDREQRRGKIRKKVATLGPVAVRDTCKVTNGIGRLHLYCCREPSGGIFLICMVCMVFSWIILPQRRTHIRRAALGRRQRRWEAVGLGLSRWLDGWPTRSHRKACYET